jgi:hypothetical protein
MFLLIGGCTTQSIVSSDQIWPEDKRMVRLERDVQGMCDELVKNITPNSVAVAWHDSLHPHSPMLSEAYIVSMFERSLIRRGFTVILDEEDAYYNLMLAMTPSKKSLLALASLKHGDKVVATKEAHFVNGSEKWSKTLCSYRFRTKNRIPIGSRP